ncbi:MAG: DUF4199 domain-containing protein [Saprospiraceae bacterium]|nr:DUF4199 domain-containing protein [Saprospiraceae bacterium]MBK8853772.1 DUF4199 domain-containing protein [Saprospiraceae bacterium]MBP6694886.1 DUF4199 domain-containing protein [Saprospiraceae bacterium]
MQNPFIKYSLYFAVINVIASLVIYLVSPELLFNMYLGWFWVLALLVLMVLAIREKRIKTNGEISLQEGFKQSWITFALGMLFSMLFSYILTNFIDPDLIELQKDAQIAAIEKMAEAWNLPEESVEKQIDEINTKPTTGFGQLLMGYMIMLLVGAIPSIIMAAIMKKSNDQIA